MNKTGFCLSHQSAGSAVHLHVAVFTLREYRVPELKTIALVAQTVRQVTIGASDERRLGFGHFVVFVIVEPRFDERLLVAFDTRFILNRDDDHGRLAGDAEIEFDRVPGRECKDLCAPDDSLAAMTLDALDVFLAMVKRREVLRIALRDRARESRKILSFGLGVARAAKFAVLLQVAGVSFASNSRHQCDDRD
jgi:hypothetical protein